ncbi:MAG: flagellar hook protein FlgE [Burkholderiaceae bacterium]|uniref:Flagellar hook protein FlgE n=1 Tax=Herminiimonas contaminans TaxID=1111140 RepID=A0ABS0EVD5_9BURK|nr:MULTISPECIES: flagellar hook protein FlgE [Oxalobacteraceae]MBF8177133.1 flagellar hook protein FlgE [Herminiimonas contaminans]MBX9797889.1 flagellar hook protein FlgE [Burkholderiaceae bacterium]
MSFQQGLSGLNAASKSLETIGNNVANANTVGFKQSQMQFSDIYASTLSGSGAAQIGIGTQIARVAQLFSQGNITASNNPLDMAINGDGFFRMSSGGTITYARNGQFELTKEGYIENAAGGRLTGYMADANGVVAIGAPTEIIINKADLAPKATTKYELKLTLDSRKDPLVANNFNPDDPTTFSDSTSVPVYDSLGNSHVLRTFYVKTAGGQWSVFATNDGVPIGYTLPTSATNPPVPLGTMQFGTGGVLTGTTPSPLVAAMAVTTGAVTPFNISIDHAGTQQFAQAFGVARQLPDGYKAGTLTGFDVANDGSIVGRYSNGQVNVLGQVILSRFANPNGLQNIGDNQWVETAESGVPLTSTPGSSGLGAVQSARVEESNVDLTAELVNMITAQRYYQANAQTIKTQDQIMQTLVNLR